MTQEKRTKEFTYWIFRDLLRIRAKSEHSGNLRADKNFWSKTAIWDVIINFGKMIFCNAYEMHMMQHIQDVIKGSFSHFSGQKIKPLLSLVHQFWFLAFFIFCDSPFLTSCSSMIVAISSISAGSVFTSAIFYNIESWKIGLRSREMLLSVKDLSTLYLIKKGPLSRFLRSQKVHFLWKSTILTILPMLFHWNSRNRS